MDFLFLLVALVVLAPFIGLGFLIAAFHRIRSLEESLRDLRVALRRSHDELVSLRAATVTPAPSETHPESPRRSADEAPASRPTPQQQQPRAADYEPAAASTAPRQTPPQPERPSLIGRIEDELTSRWLVWLGAVAIALSGTFFVKYAIEHEWLRPAARVTIGVILGLVLALAGEWLRQRPLQRAIAQVRPDYVPPALTASGLFVAFTSIYAAYALYGLLAPLVAFLGLACVALLAVGLSLLEGWFVALLGLLGALVTPALVSSTSPSAWTLFSYLIVVEVACLAVVRLRGWWWLALATLVGVAGWPVLWMLSASWHIADVLPLGLYLLLSAGAFLAAHAGLPEPELRENLFEEVGHLDPPETVVFVAGAAIAAVLTSMVMRADHSTLSLVLFGIGATLWLAAARASRPLEALALIAALATLAVVVTLPSPRSIAPLGVHAYPPLVPGELNRFVAVNAVLGGLFGVGGFAALWGARRPWIWTAISGAVPVTMLIAAYWRILHFEVALAWSPLALALAALALVCAERVARDRETPGFETALGLYAAAVVGLISLAAAMSIREAWLTVALSLELPALAAIRNRVPTRALELLAGAIATVVLVRLVFNYNILGYPLTGSHVLNWVLYGYGIPAAAFYWASRLSRGVASEWLVTAFEAGAIAFAVLLISLEIRIVVTGAIETPHYSLFEESLQSIAWMSVGATLAAASSRSSSKVAFVGVRILLGLAAAQVLFVQLLASNPLFSGEAVGHAPVLNALLLAYAVPAGFAFAVAARIAARFPPPAALVSAAAGYVLVFVWISLEVRRAFHGPILSLGPTSDAEVYAYSVVWLLYAAVLLAVGIFFKASAVRHAALAVLAATCVKVFLFDMSGLTGLYRAASFLGLGLCLVGIGFLYQRFVAAPPATAPPPA